MENATLTHVDKTFRGGRSMFCTQRKNQPLASRCATTRTRHFAQRPPTWESPSHACPAPPNELTSHRSENA